MYARLYKGVGPRPGWPADSGFEVAVGALLTQNTAWRHVNRAIATLKARRLLSARSLYDVPDRDLAEAIRPAGYYNVKARRLKNFVNFLFEECNGDLDRFLSGDLGTLRERLLSVNGVGPETADSILLYAGNKPTFVVDAYTRRILFRHNCTPEEIPYDELRSFFMDCLEPDTTMFNEYHALLVRLGHTFCVRKDPKCTECPARGWNEE